MKKQRKDMVAGVKYRGYGYINEFGEFEFTPEQTGINKGKRKVLKEGDGFSIAETTNLVLVTVKVPHKFKGVELVKEYLRVMNNVLNILRDYDI